MNKQIMMMKTEFKNNWNTPSTRTVFKWHVVAFIIFIVLMWIMWYIGIEADKTLRSNNYTKFPWPVWPMLIWALVLRYHYNAVYGKRKRLPDDFFEKKKSGN